MTDEIKELEPGLHPTGERASLRRRQAQPPARQQALPAACSPPALTLSVQRACMCPQPPQHLKTLSPLPQGCRGQRKAQGVPSAKSSFPEAPSQSLTLALWGDTARMDFTRPAAPQRAGLRNRCDQESPGGKMRKRFLRTRTTAGAKCYLGPC